MHKRITSVAALILLFVSLPALCAPDIAPDRQRGEGPFNRLILRGVIVVNGEGAPPIGPMDVVIEGDRIASIHNVGFPGVPIEESGRPQAKEGDRVMELDGYYLLPGFIDMHAHFGGDDQGVPAEYPAKLWLAHGITTIRNFDALNDVGTCLFIRSEAYMNNGQTDKAIESFQYTITEFPYAQAWDPRGWYWSVKEKSQASIDVLSGKNMNDQDKISQPAL